VPLSEEQRTKIAEWRRSKGAEKCGACGFDGGMLYGDIVILLGAGAVIGEPGTGNVGVVPITCSRCGYTMLFEVTSLPL
jgi:hypothetical protein